MIPVKKLALLAGCLACGLAPVRAQTILLQSSYDPNVGGIALRNINSGVNSGYQGLAQTVPTTNDATLTSVQFFVKGIISPGTATFSLYSVSAPSDTNWVATSLVASVSNISIATANSWVTINLPSIAITGSSYYSFTLRADTGLDVGIGQNGVSNYWTATFGSPSYGGILPFQPDNQDIAFTASGFSVPEPSTSAALAGMGALGFAAYRRRRRTQQ